MSWDKTGIRGNFLYMYKQNVMAMKQIFAIAYHFFTVFIESGALEYK